MPVAQICLNTPLPHLDHPFEYQIPEELAEDAQFGVRVRVPFGARRRAMDAIVTGVSETASYPGRLQRLKTVVSPVRVLDPEVWRLVGAVADRQAGTRADVLRLAIPRRHARAERDWLSSHPEQQSIPSAPAPPSGAPRWELRPRTGCVDLPDDVVLAGWVTDAIQPALAAADRGGQAILVVPDFRDQAQVCAALRILRPDLVVCNVDSRQDDADRYRTFLSSLTGAPAVLVGRRSVLFAPAPRLSTIVLVDDGDPSYAEPHAPYAHARDVALLRQQLSGCELVFCAQSRSTALERLIEVGWVAPAPTPATRPRVIPTSLIPEEGPSWRLPPLVFQQLHEGLRGGPVLVQVARATETEQTGAGLTRTAQELGRAFPGIPVMTASSEQILTQVPAEPALVLATAGAEPRAAGGGYRAVVLLDAGAVVSRPKLDAAEQALRGWMNAAALGAPGCTVVLTQVSGRLSDALRLWDPGPFAAAELQDRRELQLPPAVRWFTVSAAEGSLTEALREAQLPPGVQQEQVLSQAGGEQVSLRVPYADGQACAAALSGVLRRWSSRRAADRLRVHADDLESL